jgi:1-phosphofructokinase family hexose kinase
VTLATVGGPPRAQIEAEFQSLGVPYHFVPTTAATRVCTTILEPSRGAVTELVEDGQPLTAEELDAFHRAYVEHAARAQVVVLIGSLPRGTPPDFYRRLLQATRAPTVLDFRGPGLLSVLDLEPLVVKPNREELALTVGQGVDSDEELLTAMRALNGRGARWVVITQGPGPVWVSSTREAYRLIPAPIHDAVNPIASGDALAATIAWARRDGRPLPEAVRLGLAAAAQNVRQLLPCRLDPRRLEAEAALVRLEAVG